MNIKLICFWIIILLFVLNNFYLFSRVLECENQEAHIFLQELHIKTLEFKIRLLERHPGEHYE